MGCEFTYSKDVVCNRMVEKGRLCSYHTHVFNERIEPTKYYKVDKVWLKQYKNSKKGE